MVARPPWGTPFHPQAQHQYRRGKVREPAGHRRHRCGSLECSNRAQPTREGGNREKRALGSGSPSNHNSEGDTSSFTNQPIAAWLTPLIRHIFGHETTVVIVVGDASIATVNVDLANDAAAGMTIAGAPPTLGSSYAQQSDGSYFDQKDDTSQCSVEWSIQHRGDGTSSSRSR